MTRGGSRGKTQGDDPNGSRRHDAAREQRKRAEAGEAVRATAKDLIRFGVPPEGESGHREVRIRVSPARWGGWEARAELFGDPQSEIRNPQSTDLHRVFRSGDRAVAAGKMVVFVRRRFPGAVPIAELHREESTR